jgi:hypothetical protein
MFYIEKLKKKKQNKTKTPDHKIFQNGSTIIIILIITVKLCSKLGQGPKHLPFALAAAVVHRVAQELY